jgi:uncharacterized OsmC-like protein
MTATQPDIINGIDRDALSKTISTIAANPDLGGATFRSASHWIDNRHVTTVIDQFSAAGGAHHRAARHQIDTDLPGPLMGTDVGPSPLEVALSALGSCVATTVAVHAAAKGIELGKVEVTIAGKLDLRGFLNLADVRTGYQRLDLKVTLQSGLAEEDVAQFVESATRFSPVLDLFRRGTEVAVMGDSAARPELRAAQHAEAT